MKIDNLNKYTVSSKFLLNSTYLVLRIDRTEQLRSNFLPFFYIRQKNNQNLVEMARTMANFLVNIFAIKALPKISSIHAQAQRRVKALDPSLDKERKTDRVSAKYFTTKLNTHCDNSQFPTLTPYTNAFFLGAHGNF